VAVGAWGGSRQQRRSRQQTRARSLRYISMSLPSDGLGRVLGSRREAGRRQRVTATARLCLPRLSEGEIPTTRERSEQKFPIHPLPQRLVLLPRRRRWEVGGERPHGRPGPFAPSPSRRRRRCHPRSGGGPEPGGRGDHVEAGRCRGGGEGRRGWPRPPGPRPPPPLFCDGTVTPPPSPSAAPPSAPARAPSLPRAPPPSLPPSLPAASRRRSRR